MYVPLRCYSHGSLLQSQNKPKEIVKRLDDLGMDSCAITDIGNLSMTVQFFQEMKKANKKPLLGIQLNICNDYSSVKSTENRIYGELIAIAKNLAGWKTLLKLVSYTNRPEHFDDQPRISLRELKEFDDGNIIFVSNNGPIAYKILDNYYVAPMPAPYYLTRDQAADNRILLCNHYKMGLNDAKSGTDDIRFFRDDFYLNSHEEMLKFFSEKDLAITNQIAGQVEEFDILGPPNLPDFPAGNFSQQDLLEELVTLGLNSRNIIENRKQEYLDRVAHELKVINEANLAGYFLIVQDIVKYIKRKAIAGAGRGSVGGSLVAYLIYITDIDPIRYNLLFSRFYNEGRNTKERVSLPDIDMDIPSALRADCIEYIKNKYGESCVGQMITFQTMQGGRALSDVLRHTTDMNFLRIKSITKELPMFGKIAPDLKDMEKRLGYSSIIRWALENTPQKFSEYCVLDNEGYKGDLAVHFEQAIRLENTNSAQSKHPAGVVISKSDLQEFCPLVMDKDNHQVCGYTMDDLEAVGGVKFDILGVKVLDKIMKVKEIVNHEKGPI